MKLYPHQTEALELTKGFNRCAYYYDMGLGKTFIASEKADSFPEKILLICQKSKIDDWIDHYRDNYNYTVFDLTNKKLLDEFVSVVGKCVGVINYDLAWRRSELSRLRGFTLILDESSMIQNEHSKRAKFVLKMQPTNVILLSGTPVSGKYEKLWSQLRLLGWNIKKRSYYNSYIITQWIDIGGFQREVVRGYKNVEHLKMKLREYGAVFKKTEEVIDLPSQNIIPIRTKPTRDYKRFMKDDVVTVGENQFIGDTALTKRLYARMLCTYLNKARLTAFKDLLESTQDRLVVFYNFNAEKDVLVQIATENDRPVSVVNGEVRDLSAYENEDNSITLIQYQAGAMGLNLQKANKVIYFSLTERSELFEQSKKRIHRIGQSKPCSYYVMYCPGTVEEHILETLRKRKDYTDALFKEYQH